LYKYAQKQIKRTVVLYNITIKQGENGGNAIFTAKAIMYKNTK